MLIERCYGTVTLSTTPRIRLSAHRYRIVTAATNKTLPDSAELWHVLPNAGGVRVDDA